MLVANAFSWLSTAPDGSAMTALFPPCLADPPKALDERLTAIATAMRATDTPTTPRFTFLSVNRFMFQVSILGDS
jgi:hypothetical protein